MATEGISQAWTGQFSGCYASVRHYAKVGNDRCRKYALLSQQAGIFGLNCVFLAGKAIPTFPVKLTKATLVALDIVGICAFPTYYDQMKKSTLDLVSSINTRQAGLAVISAGRVIETFSNLALSLGSLAAACAGYTGDEEGQQYAYNSMIVWGEVSLALTYSLDLAYIYINRKALAKIPTILPEEGLATLKSMDERRKPNALSCHLRCCMDKDTLRKLLRVVKRINDENPVLTSMLLDIVRRNVVTESRYDDCGQFVLNTMGLGCLVVYKYLTPNNLQAATLNTFLSGCWLVVAIIKTKKQIEQRDDMENEPVSTENLDNLDAIELQELN